MKGFHIFVGTHNCGMVGLCNNVFPIVLSLSGLGCRALQVKRKIHKHSSIVNLAVQQMMLH